MNIKLHNTVYDNAKIFVVFLIFMVIVVVVVMVVVVVVVVTGLAAPYMNIKLHNMIMRKYTLCF